MQFWVILLIHSRQLCATVLSFGSPKTTRAIHGRLMLWEANSTEQLAGLFEEYSLEAQSAYTWFATRRTQCMVRQARFVSFGTENSLGMRELCPLARWCSPGDVSVEACGLKMSDAAWIRSVSPAAWLLGQGELPCVGPVLQLGAKPQWGPDAAHPTGQCCEHTAHLQPFSVHLARSYVVTVCSTAHSALTLLFISHGR